MTALSIILDIVLILISLVLIAAVLMQQGQRQGLGAISGGAETFFGKTKGRSIDAKLAKITKICAVAFIVLAIATTMVVSHNNNTIADPAAALQEITENLEDAAATDAATADDTAAADDAAADDAAATDAEPAEAEAEPAEAEAEPAEAEATDAPAEEPAA